MHTRKFLILPLFLILLSSAIVPYSFASIESEAQEDIDAGCRDGQTLVHRISYKDYVCVVPSTADRWEELGLAEIVAEHPLDPVQETPEIETIEIPKPSSTPIPKRPTSTSDNSQCRDGQSLVFRFVHHDTFCTSSSTAASWERLGLAEIIQTEQLEDEEIKDSEPDVNSLNEINVIPKSPDEELVTKKSTPGNVYRQDAEPTNWLNGELWVDTDNDDIWVNVFGTATSLVPAVTDSGETDNISDNIPFMSETSDFLQTPEIYELDDGIWVAVGYDNTNTMLIEGDTGIIVIDTLSSYEASKKVLEEFKSITDKPVKIIIYTMITPEQVEGTKAFLDEGDGSVEIIINEYLLGNYNAAYELDVPATDIFRYDFSIDVSNVKMKLLFGGGVYSDQTYIYLPDIEGMLIGDSVNGVYPFILPIEDLEHLID